MSSVAAPVLLVGGWTLAAARRPGFDPVSETISALAAHGAPHRWLMTTALVGVGAAHMLTALALRPAATAGRFVLALGGVATVLVAAFPLSAAGESRPHALAAAVSFGGLALWPALAAPRAGPTPPVLRRVVAVPVSVLLLGLLLWFTAELAMTGPLVGLTERVAAGAQALWPLVAVVGCRVAPRPDTALAS